MTLARLSLQISFAYLLIGNHDQVLSSENKTSPGVVTYSLSAGTLDIPNRLLAAGVLYSISIWSVSQAGIRSTSPVKFSWQTLPNAPLVKIQAHPDQFSGSHRPVFQFAADWGNFNSSLPGSQSGLLVFEVKVVGAGGLGEFHTPGNCTTAFWNSNAVTPRTGKSTAEDCFVGTCASESCNYTVSLASSGTYVLAVRTRLANSAPSSVRPMTVAAVSLAFSKHNFQVDLNSSQPIVVVFPPCVDFTAGCRL